MMDKKEYERVLKDIEERNFNAIDESCMSDLDMFLCANQGVLKSALRAQIEAVADAVTTPVAPVWQTIDSAPKDGTSILALDPDMHGRPFTARWAKAFSPDHYVESHSGWYAEGYDKRCKPTHWQPLPQPPQAEG